MTSEVVVINPDGVAMAADSTLTLGSPTSGAGKVYRNFSKIYDLSKDAPFAAMIWGAPRLAGVPWDTLFGLYQETSPDTSTVEVYALGFDQWLDETFVVSADARRRAWRGVLCGALDQCFAEAHAFVATRSDFNARVRAAAVNLRRRLQDCTPLRHLEKDDVAAQVGLQMARNHEYYDSLIDARLPSSGDLTEKTRGLLHHVLSESTCRNHPSTVASGVVFAGLGLRRTMPAYAAIGYTFEGEHIRRSPVNYREVGAHSVPFAPSRAGSPPRPRPPAVEAFAQTAEVTAFLDGVHPELEEHLQSMWRDATLEVADAVPLLALGCLKSVLGDLQINLDEAQRAEVSSAFQEAVIAVWSHAHSKSDRRNLAQARASFRGEVERTVRVLPRQTLAVVAEDLVRLAVTRQQLNADAVETVGGNIEVAVISRAQGFTWAKRRDEAR